MKKLFVLLTIMLINLACIPVIFASSGEVQGPLTLTALIEKMPGYEKKEISLVGTIVGACGSGCKVWVSDGPYKEGDPVALVWAKDDAFKFKTDANGKQVELKGFAVAKYVDLCAIGNKQDETKTGAAGDISGKNKKDCDPPVKVKAATEEGAKQLKSITFFATSVEYLM